MLYRMKQYIVAKNLSRDYKSFYNDLSGIW